MNEPKHFVLVFGDPDQNGDTIESERYEAGDRYPAFTVKPGDLLLLYCTEGYAKYPLQFPGIGVAIHTSDRLIQYRWIPFAMPIPRALIDLTFDPDDQRKMGQLRFNQFRAFTISSGSFSQTISGQTLGTI
jgi:hypothetical protein